MAKTKKTITKDALEAWIKAVEAWIANAKGIVSTFDSSNPPPPPPPPPQH
jgi:hypothetical protein